MASKATPQDLEALGFSPSQFGNPQDWDVDGGYLQSVLDLAAVQVSEAVGDSAYAAAATGSREYTYQKQSELMLAEAELWRRVETFERRSRVSAGQDSGGETISSRALKNAEEATSRAWYFLTRLGASEPGSGIAVGFVETGPFEAIG